jgi:hypothetical protein
MPKKQKVRFYRGDKRPGNHIIWQVVEHPTKNVVAEYFFEEDAHRLVKFQNKHKVWQSQGGIPKFLYINISK